MFENITLNYENKDLRPPFILEDVQGITFNNINAQKEENIATFWLDKVSDFALTSRSNKKNIYISNTKKKRKKVD